MRSRWGSILRPIMRPCNVRAASGVLWLTLCATLATTLSGASYAYSPAELRSYTSAVSALRQGRVAVAVTRVREGLRSVPESTILNNMAGAMYFASGETDKADAAWRSVMADRPDDPIAAYGRGLVAMSRRRWDEAVSLIGTASNRGDRTSCILARLYADSLRGVPSAETVALPDSHLAARLGLEAHAARIRGDHARALADVRRALDAHHGGRYAEPSGILMRFDRSAPLKPAGIEPVLKPVLGFLLRDTESVADGGAEMMWRMLAIEPSRAALARMGSQAAEALGDSSAARRLGGLALAIDPEAFDAADAARIVAGPYRSADPLWAASPDRRLIALTFDDGPRREPTERLLGILSRAGARATFFVTGRYSAANPDVVAALARAGMEIANHSYSHAALPTLTEAQIMRELVRTSACIQDVTGQAPAFYRPPGGRISNVVLRVGGTLGMRACMWTVNAQQAEQQGARAVRDLVVGQARPGAVVLMHNGSAATLQALPEIIVALRRRGYEFATVSELARHGT